MPEEMNRGLGSINAPVEQSQSSEQAVATPNSSLAMLNKKREADNVVQEKNTGITLGKIKDEAKQELAQEMIANQMDKQQRMAEKESAIGQGYNAGLYDASALQQAAMQSQNDTSYAQNYSDQPTRQSNGLGKLY